MKNKRTSVQARSLGALALVTLFLPGCNWFKKEAPASAAPAPVAAAPTEATSGATGRVIATSQGTPILVESDFHKDLEMLLQGDQQLQILPHLPPQQQREVYQNILDQYFVNNYVMERFIRENKLDESAEFKANMEATRKAVERLLYSRAFEQSIVNQISISDAQAEEFYKDNKDTLPDFSVAPFVKQEEGVKAVAVQADSEAQAQQLLAKARELHSLADAAQSMNKQVMDVGVINTKRPTVDPNLAAALNGMKTFPAFEVVRVRSGIYIVVQGISRQAGQMAPFEEVKDQVKAVMQMQEFIKLLEQRMNELKKKYDIVVDREFVNSLVRDVSPASAQAPAMDMLPEVPAAPAASGSVAQAA